MLDEAHIYCPEQGEADSALAVSALCSLGRKRGFCAVLATQRISKLAKDAAAECNNKLTGRTSLDVDMKRAADDLGFANKAEKLSLRDLSDGEFFVYGPAMPKGVSRVLVGPVQTKHPKAGSHLAAVVPPPTGKVKALLAKLSDLPAEAEAREKTVADLKRDLATAKRQLTEARKAQPPPPPPVKTDEGKAQKVAELKTELSRYRRALEAAMKILVKVKAIDFSVESDDDRKALEHAIAAAVKQVTAPFEKRVTGLVERVAGFKLAAQHAEEEIGRLLDAKLDLSVQVQHREPYRIATAPAARAAAPKRAAVPRPDGFVITGPMQRILNALAWAEGVRMATLAKGQLAFLSDASPTSSSFGNNVSALRTAGLLEYPANGRVALTDSGRTDAHADSDTPTTSEELQAAICAKLPRPQSRLIVELVKVHPEALAKDELAARGEASPTSSSFGNNVSALRSLGLVDYPSPGFVVAAPALFLES